jgi:hypothetical protein
MRIELLQGRLPVNENPGLDSTDPRFDEILTLSQKGQHTEAAELSEATLADGIYDIRLICFFLYGYWLENGLASFLVLMDCLNNVVSENWAAVGPLSNRNRNLEKSLDWMFRQILKKIQYEQNKHSPLWRQWQTADTEVEVDKILEAGKTFRSGINRQLEASADASINQLNKIEQWLLVFRQIAAQPEADEIEDNPMAEDLDPITALKTTGLEIGMSYHMELLLKKLAAFERVIQENKFLQAALLADDINQSLDNFDPKLYFPKLFENFVSQQALNFEELAAHAYRREEPQWQVMQEWLKVDIDGFITHG